MLKFRCYYFCVGVPLKKVAVGRKYQKARKIYEKLLITHSEVVLFLIHVTKMTEDSDSSSLSSDKMVIHDHEEEELETVEVLKPSPWGSIFPSIDHK